MRTDVKVGIALGALILIVAVSYYGTRDHNEIQLADSGAAAREHNAKVLQELLTPRQPERRATRTKPGKETAPPRSRSRQGRGSSRAQGDRMAAPSQRLDASRPVPSRPMITPSRAPAGQSAPAPLPTKVSTPANQAEPTLRPLARKSPQEKPTDADPGRSALTLQGRTPEPDQTKPATPPLQRGKPRQHVVQPGESFATIAEHYYGHQRHGRFLAQANPDVDPRGMKVGSTIEVPTLPAAVTTPVRSSRTAAPGADVYEVKTGDSLYDIARSKLGSASRWREIYELNKEAIGQDPAKIQVGQMLKLPQR